MTGRVGLRIVAVVFLASAAGCGASASPESRNTVEVLKFGVAPYHPTPGENRQRYQALVDELTEKLGMPVELVVAGDWVGVSTALQTGTVDVATLGPWGYVLARDGDPTIEPLVTTKVKGEPGYHAVMLARADAPFDTLDEAIALSEKGPKLKISFSDVGSTSGWLIPQAEFKRRGLDPKAIFDYYEGTPHPAQAIGLLSEQADIATDWEKHADTLAAAGKFDRSKVKVVWKSERLPNSPIAVRGGLPADLKKKLQQFFVAMTPEQAEKLMPGTTGYVESDGTNYGVIERAGKLVGRLK